MNTSKKTIALAIGGAFALSISATTVNAAENPFTAKTLSSGYQVAESATKMKDGKCGAGKCGAEKKAAESATKMKDGKCGAGKCGTSKKVATEKAAEGKCSAEKAAEGKCSAEMKNQSK